MSARRPIVAGASSGVQGAGLCRSHAIKTNPYRRARKARTLVANERSAAGRPEECRGKAACRASRRVCRSSYTCTRIHRARSAALKASKERETFPMCFIAFSIVLTFVIALRFVCERRATATRFRETAFRRRPPVSAIPEQPPRAATRWRDRSVLAKVLRSRLPGKGPRP